MEEKKISDKTERENTDFISEQIEKESISARELRKARRAEKKAEKKRREEEKTLLENVLETAAYAAIALCIALVLKKWIMQPIIVDGDSMNDTLEDKNIVFAVKLGYEPERFDVVTLNSPVDGRLLIKRIIGLPGETVYVDESDAIWITPEDGDTYKLDDPYGYFSGIVKSKMILCSNNEDGSYTLGDDEYFCMGDNRYNSMDSRVIGGISRDDISGHAIVRLWPLTKIGDFDKGNE